MHQKFSPSAFHQGNVHGCFSTSADLLIQQSSFAHKIQNANTGARAIGEKHFVLYKRFVVD
jgi:hypothetical protein